MNQTIALLGQPNSGKSSVFNGLTGSHQHVGNWPGKTVEQKTGSFRCGNETIEVVDLPGSYSLSAGSDEEVITASYIESGKADLVAILVDSSQLERSLYMCMDFVGICTPAVLILNLMDVAENKGIEINVAQLEKRLGIPVIPFVAADSKRYGALKEKLQQALSDGKVIDQNVLMRFYAEDPGMDFVSVVAKQLESAQMTKEKQAVLELEKTDRGLMQSGKQKYACIDSLVAETVKRKEAKAELSSFDRKALGRRSGKWMALGFILLAMMAAMLVAAPVMGLGAMIPGILEAPLKNLMTAGHVWDPLAKVVYVVLPNILFFAVAMSGFVIGVTFVFSLMEDIGYMARISVVFNREMEQLGLQGKSVCSFLMSMGCNMAGIAGSRVIDNAGQRFLTMILVWSVPCGTLLSLAPMLATIFFGPVGGFLILLFMLVITVCSMFLASRLFGRKLIKEEESYGIVMELPPYHKPKWGHIIRMTLQKVWDIFSRAFKVIFLVSIVFYLLSYPWFGTESPLSFIGQKIEPVTSFFGMSWEMFMAYLSSMVTKESMLGVLNALYSNHADMVSAAFNAKSLGITEGLAALLPQVISKPQALGFIMAIVFNVPCTMTVATTFQETHSKKWLGLSALYYIGFSLVLSCIFYHIGLLIW